jgi:hypothetical protein
MSSEIRCRDRDDLMRHSVGRAFFLSDRTEDYRLKFFSNKLRALMRYRDAVIGRLADGLWTPFTGADLMSAIKA